MTKRVTYIPTLQEYMRKRRKQRTELQDLKTCKECDYYRNDSDVCLWGDNVRVLTALKTCPITFREL